MKMLPLTLLAVASPVLAHPGDHTAAGASHFFTDPWHMGVMAAVLVAVALGVSVIRVFLR